MISRAIISLQRSAAPWAAALSISRALDESRFLSVCAVHQSRPLPRWLPRRRFALEYFAIDLHELLHVPRNILLGENRRHRTLGLTGAAIDALVRVDEELLIAFVNAIDWTHVDTRFVLHADAGFGDYVGHCSLTLA